MADERKIVIELKAKGTSSDVSSASSQEVGDGSSSNLSDNLKKSMHPVASMEKAMLGKNVLVYSAYQRAKETIKSVAMYSAERYFNLTENYKSEQDLSNTMNILSDVTSTAGSILGSAAMGATIGGPIGAVVGTAVGVVGSAVNFAFQATKRTREQNKQINTMNMQSSFQMVKMGLIDNGANTLN